MTFGFMRYAQPPSGGILDAIIETMVLMSMADDNVTQDEVQALANLAGSFMQKNPQYGQMTIEQLLQKCDAFAKRAVEQGLQTRLAAVSQALETQDNRALAVFFALVISAADGHLDSGERRMLGALQQAFGLTDANMQEIIQAFQQAVNQNRGQQ